MNLEVKDEFGISGDVGKYGSGGVLMTPSRRRCKRERESRHGAQAVANAGMKVLGKRVAELE